MQVYVKLTVAVFVGNKDMKHTGSVLRENGIKKLSESGKAACERYLCMCVCVYVCMCVCMYLKESQTCV